MMLQDQSLCCGCNDRTVFFIPLVPFPLIRGGAI